MTGIEALKQQISAANGARLKALEQAQRYEIGSISHRQNVRRAATWDVEILRLHDELKKLERAE